MKANYLFIMNPVSGANAERETIKKKLQIELGDSVIHIIETRGKDDISLIKEHLENNPWKAIIAGGGDGTIRMIAKAARGFDVPIGIIPMGSANGLARCLGVDEISTAVAAIKNGKTRNLDIININNELCLHLSDFGFNASLIRKFDNEDERGMISYFKSSLKQFTEMKPYHFEIKINGKTEQTQARMLVVANGDKYGTGAIINPVGKIDDGIMEIISLNPEGFDDMVAMSFDLFRGTLDESDDVKIWSGREAEIINLDKADFQIDGEVMDTPDQVSISCQANQQKFFSQH